jgi:hypothetical protein
MNVIFKMSFLLCFLALFSGLAQAYEATKFAKFSSSNPLYGTELTIDGVKYEIYDGSADIWDSGRKVTFRFNVKMGERYKKINISQLQFTHHFEQPYEQYAGKGERTFSNYREKITDVKWRTFSTNQFKPVALHANTYGASMHVYWSAEHILTEPKRHDSFWFLSPNINQSTLTFELQHPSGNADQLEMSANYQVEMVESVGTDYQGDKLELQKTHQVNLVMTKARFELKN